ncbi:SH3 domain-containing protein [Labrys monachus]|uniref:SH3-like domain-containing protein n=1 Tax=Labrys monachus TaxID=217067 RepID=A0ABU0F912_9HYPH|nr:SH3 domain-containing protein [Labrys monachus]MDQ0391026.1 SH3-like domain-containing protein [Labrys monachus]
MSYYEEESPRLSPIARIGFAGAFCAFALAAGVYYLHRQHQQAEMSAASQVDPAILADPTVAQFIAGSDKGPGNDVTGSLPTAASTSSEQLGPVSGLPMPRFVSLKPDKVNVRQGPSRDQAVAFIYQKANLPVEVIAEFENWRRIRDSEGAEGWVLQSLLSGKRTALIAPWSKETTLMLHSRADLKASPTAMLQPGVLATIRSCNVNWCRINGDGFDGWIQESNLWGAYPGETIE